jgi:hypothetical protein
MMAACTFRSACLIRGSRWIAPLRAEYWYFWTSPQYRRRPRGILDARLRIGNDERKIERNQQDAVIARSACDDLSDVAQRAKAEAIHFFFFAARWIASRSLSSGARSRDPLARNDD